MLSGCIAHNLFAADNDHNQAQASPSAACQPQRWSKWSSQCQLLTGLMCYRDLLQLGFCQGNMQHAFQGCQTKLRIEGQNRVMSLNNVRDPSLRQSRPEQAWSNLGYLPLTPMTISRGSGSEEQTCSGLLLLPPIKIRKYCR